jgi:hypothetical protein
MNSCPAGMSILIYLLGKDKYKFLKIYQPGLRCRGFRKVPNSASLGVSRLYFRYKILLKVKKNGKQFICSQGKGRSKYFIIYQSAV